MTIPPHAQQYATMLAEVLAIITTDVFAQRLSNAQQSAFLFVRAKAHSEGEQGSSDSIQRLGREDDPSSS